jgi:type VI protein secretion system component Hcp
MRSWMLTGVLVLALCAPALADDGPVGFVRIDGVRGESRAKPGWIDALSINMNCGQLVSGQTAHGGATRTLTLKFVHRIDRASQPLLQAATTGLPFAKAYVEQQGARYELTQVLVTRVVKTNLVGDTPAEHVTLVFSQCARH